MMPHSIQTFGDSAEIKAQMSAYKVAWDNLNLGSQSEFYGKTIPKEKVDFTETFATTQLGSLFTSDKVVTEMRGPYNCNMLYRQTKVMPDVVVYNDDHYVALHPLGEPGRDLGSHGSRASHLMVVPWKDGAITLNEMFPSTEAEVNDLDARNAFLEDAYAALRNNCPVSECGSKVVARAAAMGVKVSLPIRDFMVDQIASFTPEFRAATPGYVLKNAADEDIAHDKGLIQMTIDALFTDPTLTIVKCIQGPENISQLMSHIHGFLLPKDRIPQGIADNYICSESILKHKQALVDDYMDLDDGCDLVRTVSVAAPLVRQMAV